MTIIDSFPEYAEAYYLNNISGTEIPNNLIRFCSHHIIQFLTDNGTEFKNTVLKEILAIHKTDIHFCSSNHPNSNGIIER